VLHLPTRSRWLLCAALSLLPCTAGRAATAGSAAGSAGAKAASGKKKPPPAQLVVPDAVREARERGETPEGPTPLFALGAPDVLEALGPWEPVPGHWVEYYVEQGGELPARVRLSVLAERPGGRFWVEVAGASPVGMPMASRMLVHGNPVRAADIERLQVYIAGQAVLELPLEEAGQVLDPSAPKAAGVRVEKLPAVEVTVQAGRYQATRLRVSRGQGALAESTTLYRAQEVPIFHLVKSESAGNKAKGKQAQGPLVVQLFASGKSGAHSMFPASAPLLEEAPAPQPAPDAGAPAPAP
jgi:hypothetical protein